MIEPCGRVLSVKGRKGEAEFVPTVKSGDFIYYKGREKDKVLCQITNMDQTPLKGLVGTFEILDPTADIPKVLDNLYQSDNTTGQINIGLTDRNVPVNLRINPFFQHVLVAGKTNRGKTHVQIVLHEEFLRLKVPSIVIDPQGEFIHLNQFSPDAIIVEEMRFEDLLSHLKFRRTIVFNMQGLPNPSKTRRCFEILSQLFIAKENDYKQAEGDKKSLQLPPIIVDIDETEIFAPDLQATAAGDKICKDSIVNIAKRGGKLGIGLIINSQRLPGLHFDVRSQCNSAIVFQITDSGSRIVLSQMPYITNYDLKRVKSLSRGTCIVTGEFVDHPLLVRVRDIKTPRAKDLDFEGMLGLRVAEEKEAENLEPLIIETGKSITFDFLSSKFPIRQIPIHGTCIVIPERFFKASWKNTLEIQGCKVIHCPDMPGGGSVYLIRRNGPNELQRIKNMAAQNLPRDTSKIPYSK